MMNQIIKPDTVDFNTLIKTNTTLTLDCQSKMINILKKEFTEEENRWYTANLYIYMNYHNTNDFPINLDTLVKLVDFANKQNAKRTLVNNFTKDEDYKILLVSKDDQKNTDEEVLIPKDENLNSKNLGGRPKEQIMMNIDTFKNMCMLVKTEKSKEIRKYYVKLENIYNKIVKEEIDNTKFLLEEKEKLLQIQIDKTKIEVLLAKERVLIDTHRKTNVFYISLFEYKGKWYIKFGISEGSINLRGDIRERINSHKNEISKELYLIHVIKIENCKDLENRFKQNVVTIEKSFTNNEIKTEIIELNETVTVESIIKLAEKLSKIKPTFQNLELELAKEKTKQMEIQLEILKYQQQPIQQIHISEEITFDEKIKTYLINNLEKVDNAKVQIDTIFNKLDIEFNKDLIDSKTLIKYVNEIFNVKFIKYNNHFVDLRFKNSSSIFPMKVYQDFIEEYIIIKNKRDRNHQEFKYKIKYEDIYIKFKQYTLNIPKLLDNNILLFEKDFKECITKLTNSKLSSDISFDKKKCKGFIGLMLKNNVV